MAEPTYDAAAHAAAIQDKETHSTSIAGGEQTMAEGTAKVSAGQEQVAAAQERRAEADKIIEEQTRRRLNEIYEDVEEIKARLPPPAPPVVIVVAPIASALVAGLSVITRCDVTHRAQVAAAHIWTFVQEHRSRVTAEGLAAEIRAISLRDIRDARAYADAVVAVVAGVVLMPGRNLPHRVEALEPVHRILAAAGDCASDSTTTTTTTVCCPPGLASTEVLRDVSHLTTLLLGSSPAFADAMRMQSDALAHSLAAFNKVGDMQRQDALGLAITARAAADALNRR